MRNYKINTIIISFVLILCVLLHNIFSIFLGNYLGTIDLVFLAAVVFFMVGLLIYTMVTVIVEKKYGNSMFVIAVGISAYLLITQSLSTIGVNMEYRLYTQDRHKVVQMFEGGKIKYNGYDQYVKLPEGYARLSKFHGLMMVDNRDNHLRIGFVADNNYLNRHQVVIYVAGDGILKNNDFGEDLRNIRRIDEHWYEATAEVMM
jgi:hypothetical protein